MSTYLDTKFTEHIPSSEIKTIFEIGSRDLLDSIQMANHYPNSEIFAFECNPEGLTECKKNWENLDENSQKRINLIDKAVHVENTKVKFYAFDRSKYDNIGASSMYKIDFSNRPPWEGDRYFGQLPPGFVQKEIEVDGIRLDTFCEEQNIKFIDLICMDLQGHELQALKSLGDQLNSVKYIITESSYISTYQGGCNFFELENYLGGFGFKFISSDKTGTERPSEKFFTNYTGGTSEFNSFFSREC